MPGFEWLITKERKTEWNLQKFRECFLLEARMISKWAVHSVKLTANCINEGRLISGTLLKMFMINLS